MVGFIEGVDRGQLSLLPESLEDWVEESNPVRVIDAFVEELDLDELGFKTAEPTDIGRPLSQLRPNINISDLNNILREVIETLGTRERKVTDKEGRPYSLRVRPYRTTDDKIDGAVITLVDIEGGREGDVVKSHRQAKNASSRQ